jgi:LacI family transcriptional regulator
MSQVAELAGVSKNTVSLALRDSPRISPATRAVVEAAAARLGYQRNAAVGELMAQLRRTGSSHFTPTLALLNANENPDATTQHPTVPVYVRGIQKRALELGYSLDEFWLHSPQMTGSRLASILRARGIRGAVVVGLLHDNKLPHAMRQLWSEIPAAVTGVRVRNPHLSFAGSDQYALALQAYEHAWNLGYRRPGLILDPIIDSLIEGRFTAGFLIGERLHRNRERPIPPFTKIEPARRDPTLFRNWIQKHCPDVLFTLYHETARWLTLIGLSAPSDIGIIQYEWRQDHPDWAGMNQRNDLVGEAAVDLVVSMIHNGLNGVPAQPVATLVTSQWVPGKTVRPQNLVPLSAS